MTARMRAICRKLAEEIMAKQTAKMINSAPYVNRLEIGRAEMNNEALDKAVIELSGNPDNALDNIGDSLWFVDSQYQFLDSTIKYYCGKFIGFKDQFTQRAKDLGFINGYRWGVEYATEGKRPDLADDVSIMFKNEEGWHDDGADIVGAWLWDKSVSFKISDLRYKPADTSYLNALSQDQSLTHKADSLTHSEQGLTHSDWFESGDLPPAGTCCQFQLTDGSESWVNCFVIGMDDLGFCVCRSEMNYMASMSQSSFRPSDHATRKAKLEKKRVVDAAMSVFVTKDKQYPRVGISALYDAGYLRSPTNKD